MTFTLIDVILIVFVAAFVVAGFILGFVQSLGSLAGAAVGIFVASRTAESVGTTVAGWLHISDATVTKIVMFSVIYLIVSRLVSLLFWGIEKSFKLLKIVPFIGSIDRLLGVILGFVEGIVAVAAVVYFAGHLLPIDIVQTKIEASQVGSWMLSFFDILKGLLPEALRTKLPEV